MTALLLALLTLAMAGPPAPPDPRPTDGPDIIEDGHVVHQVIVYGDLAVEKARKKVLEDLRTEGYTHVQDKGDYLLVRSDEPWMGEVRVYDDGFVRMKRQPFRVVGPDLPWASQNSPLSYAGCVIYWWACVKTGGQTVGRRKFMAQKVRTLDAVHPDAVALADRVADQQTEQKVNDLPDQLEALWSDGTPIDLGDAHLDTIAERKAALLSYWDSRSDTVWGDRVRLGVEAFIRGEIQGTPDAFTDPEIAAFNAQRHSERVLDLDSPWDVVSADVKTPW